MYAEIINNVIVKVMNSLPQEYGTDGKLLNETWYRENRGIYRVDAVPQAYDPFYQYPVPRPFPEWNITFSIGKVSKVEVIYDIVDKSLEDLKKQKLKEIADLRYNYVSKGMVVLTTTNRELRVDSDGEAQFNLLSMSQLAVEGCDEFKDLNDDFVSVTFQEIQEITATVFSKVKDCFKNEKRVYNLIKDSADFEELKLAVAEFSNMWPTGTVYEEMLVANASVIEEMM